MASSSPPCGCVISGVVLSVIFQEYYRREHTGSSWFTLHGIPDVRVEATDHDEHALRKYLVLTGFSAWSPFDEDPTPLDGVPAPSSSHVSSTPVGLLVLRPPLLAAAQGGAGTSSSSSATTTGNATPVLTARETEFLMAAKDKSRPYRLMMLVTASTVDQGNVKIDFSIIVVSREARDPVIVPTKISNMLDSTAAMDAIVNATRHHPLLSAPSSYNDDAPRMEKKATEEGESQSAAQKAYRAKVVELEEALSQSHELLAEIHELERLLLPPQ